MIEPIDEPHIRAGGTTALGIVGFVPRHGIAQDYDWSGDALHGAQEIELVLARLDASWIKHKPLPADAPSKRFGVAAGKSQVSAIGHNLDSFGRDAEIANQLRGFRMGVGKQ